MTTIHSTSTAWTQETVWVESGKVQLPEVTIYSYLQPIDMASYPDPIMSATGTELQYLLSQEHLKASTSSMSDTESTSVEISVLPVTYTTEYLTTTFVTIYPTNKLLEPQNVKLQPLTSVLPTSTALTEPGSTVQTSSETSILTIPTMNTVVPVYVKTLPSDVDRNLLGRDELARDIVSPTFEPTPFHEGHHIKSSSDRIPQNTLTVLIYILGAIIITSVIIHLSLLLRDRRDSTDLSYTTKPPRPGLRKRLSLSMSMTTGRRPSLVSTNSTEATYVSGNAVSIGKAGGKGLGVGGQENEVRRTPSAPLLEV